MELTVAGDVTLDLATKDDLTHHHERLHKLLDRLAPPSARYVRTQASGSTASSFSGSGPTAIAFVPFGPAPGRIWAVQWVAVWVGTSPAAGAVANLFAAICIGRSPVGPGTQQILTSVSVNNSDVVVPGQAVPASITVPDKTIVLPEDQLYLLLSGSGLVASTSYNATAGVLDMPDSEQSVLW